LLVKQMLRAAAEGGDLGWRRVGEAVLGVVFLATPHAGSPLANVADALRSVLGPSAATLDLERYSAKLLDLREWYSEFSVRNAIETVAFAETRPSKVHGVSIGIVVLQESAWPGGTAKTISIDNVDHFEIAQPPTRDATVYKDVLSNLRHWLTRDNDPSQVPLERDTFESESEEISRFLFRTRRVPLFGRDDELRELQTFLDDPRQFTWCAVTGPGGSGKSRLALEFCLQLPPKWRAGFLKVWTSSEFRAWTPNRPTLIVIDYVSARATDIGLIVRGLEGRSLTLPFPVRLVLLERERDGLWVREFLGAGEDLRTSTRSQYVSFPAEPNPPSNDPYAEVIRLQTLVAKRLSPEALWDCMSSVFNSPTSNHTGRSNHADHKGKLLAQILEIDPSRRPLFAAFFADAISADPNMLEWDRKALVENVLRREQEKFWKPRGVTDVELDVLTLATLVRGVGHDCPDLPPAARDSKQFSPERYAIACGASASERLPPLEPDMVGEIFVLDRFRPSSKRSQAEEMRDRGWKIDSLEMSAFFSRAAKDFQDHPTLWYLGSSPQTASLRERYIWLRMAAEQLLPICAGNGLGSDARNRASSWRDAFWESYRELLVLASGDKGNQTNSILFARALNRLGYTLAAVMGDGERAIAVFDELVARFGDAAEPALREAVARAMVDKGLTLGRLNRSEDAIAVYDELLARFGAATEPALREPVARAMVDKGLTLGRLSRSEDEIAVYDELVSRFGDAAEPALREQVARAMVNKGFGLSQLNRSEDEIAVYDELMARFGDAAEPALREAVARAMFGKGVTLNQLSRSEDAIALYDELVARFGDATEPALRERVAGAMFNKGVTLNQLNRSEDASAVYDELVARFGDAVEPPLRAQVALAMFNKGPTLGQLNRSEDEIAVYNELVARFGDAAEPALREPVARAMLNKGLTLGQLNRSEDASAVYNELVARFRDAAEPPLRVQVALAMFNKVRTLGRLNRSEDAIAVFDELLARFGDADEPALRKIVEGTKSLWGLQRHSR
jgi:tetratricopeptide (TPR) repeat protein